MLSLISLLFSLIFFAGLGIAIKPPFPDPLEKEKFSGVSEGALASVDVPVTDSESIPGRLKTPRIAGRSEFNAGIESANPSQNTDPPSQGSDTLLTESPKSKGKQLLTGSGLNDQSSDSASVKQGDTLIGESPKSRGRKPPSSGGVSDAISTGADASPNTGDNRRKPPSLKPSEGSSSFAPTNPSAPGGSPASGFLPYTCDSLPAGADRVPFSCFDQNKLKDYCKQTFRSGQTVVGPAGVNSGVKRYTVDTSVKANWFQALGLCQAQNMSLATVESYEDQKALSLVLNNAGVQNAWLSGNDLGQINKYTWITTGQPLTWTNWYDGEPNHESAGNETEHCIEVVNYRWRWNDNLCTNQEYFVCQYYSNN